ncbi:MAG: group II intron reverse transcriptase domain-containing protein [Candidatus Levybacteria bacterium]|nr:group II intron reverse transcriptase domain-containing protein [Candidatus Levybacteria bacterium]
MAEYNNLIVLENLFQAWDEFLVGKKEKNDVQLFSRHLEDNLFSLHQALKSKTYRHGSYESFYVHDPKQRHIHKANIADRVIHHLLYRYLYAVFDKTFICDSYSCRIDKGTHKAVKRLQRFTRQVSKNYTQSCWALKCDIKKFFASVDHMILLDVLKQKIIDNDILELLAKVIDSFSTKPGKGIPLGNLTSQVFANIYMNEFDHFVKEQLKIKHYIRYADDFIFLAPQREALEELIPLLENFLTEHLQVELHPKKIILRKLTWGIDFLGYTLLPYDVILPRPKTRRRMFVKLLVLVE